MAGKADSTTLTSDEFSKIVAARLALDDRGIDIDDQRRFAIEKKFGNARLNPSDEDVALVELKSAIIDGFLIFPDTVKSWDARLRYSFAVQEILRREQNDSAQAVRDGKKTLAEHGAYMKEFMGRSMAVSAAVGEAMAAVPQNEKDAADIDAVATER